MFRSYRYMAHPLQLAANAAKHVLMVLISFSLVFNTILIAYRVQSAFGATEVITQAQSHNDSYFRVDIFHDRLDRIAYCLQYGVSFNAGTHYSVEPFPNKKDVVWLLRQGPKTMAELRAGKTINGRHFAGDTLNAIFQCAIWISCPEYAEKNNAERIFKYSSIHHRNEIRPYVEYLLSEAQKHKNDPDLDSVQLVLLKSSSSQNILAQAFDVDVTFKKVSGNERISRGNAEYATNGASFDIYSAHNNQKVTTITTDQDGTSSTKLMPYTNYYAREIANPKGYKLNPSPIYFSTGGAHTTVTLHDAPATAKVVAYKVDAATGSVAQAGTSLAGAELVLTDASGIEHTANTNDKGEIVFENVALGAFRIYEKKAPVGYVLSDMTLEGSVRASDYSDAIRSQGIIVYQLKDKLLELPQAFDIEIAKFKSQNDDWDTSNGQEIGAAGVSFDIISNTTNKRIGTITTNSQGFADTASDTSLWFGSGERKEGIRGAIPYDKNGYTIREIAETVPSGFDHVDDFVIDASELSNGVKLHYILNDKALNSRIQIVKVDSTSKQTVPLAGFSFELLDANKKAITQELWYPNHVELSTFTTDETGCVTLPERLFPGTYYIREISAQAPYIVAQEDIAFSVSDSYQDIHAATIVKVEDKKARGKARLQKVESPHDEAASALRYSHDLSGAEFDVIAKEDIVAPDGTVEAVTGAIVDHITTDAKGSALTQDLPLGKGSAAYLVVETKAPVGYVVDPTPQEFVLNYVDQTTEIVYSDVEVANYPTKLRLRKLIAGTQEPLAGATFAIWNSSDSVYFPPQTSPSIAIAAAEGMELQLLAKTEASESYAMSFDTEQGVYTARVPSGSYGLYEGDSELCSLELTDATQYAKLQGEKVELVDSLTKPNAELLEVTSDENGLADIIYLAPGTYCIQEITAPAGYLVDPQVFRFSVSEDGLIEGKHDFEIVVENDFTKLEINKRDVTSQEELPGAKLTLQKLDGEVIDEWVSEATPHKLQALALGEYVLTETMSPRTYDKVTSMNFSVLPTGVIQKIAMLDEPIEIAARLDKRQEIADPTAAYTEANGDGKNTRETTVSDTGIYRYYLDYKSDSSTWTDEFTVTDELHTATSSLAHLVSITTPEAIGDRDGLFNIWYKTNKLPVDFVEDKSFNATLSDKHENAWLDTEEVLAITGEDRRVIDFSGWKLWKADVDTTEQTTLEVSDLQLAEGEYVTAFRFEYGSVDKGFTTRTSLWDRDNIKDQHDDMYKEEPVTGDGRASAQITMQVTENYHSGKQLDNEAKVSAYRNGGGDKLEDHDGDKVVQVPKTEKPTEPEHPLEKTGDSLVIELIGAGACIALVAFGLLRYRLRYRR